MVMAGQVLPRFGMGDLGNRTPFRDDLIPVRKPFASKQAPHTFISKLGLTRGAHPAISKRLICFIMRAVST